MRTWEDLLPGSQNKPLVTTPLDTPRLVNELVHVSYEVLEEEQVSPAAFPSDLLDSTQQRSVLIVCCSSNFKRFEVINSGLSGYYDVDND